MVTPRAALNTDAVIHALYGHSWDRGTVTEAISGRPVVIQHQLPRRFRQLVPGLVGADLWRPYAELTPPLDLATFENALRPEQDPGLPDLLASYAPFLAQVAANLEKADLRAHPKRTELSHLADLCRRVCVQPTVISGHPRLLNRLADLLIALDTPADAELLTFDRIFDFLCADLGKPCRILPSWRTTATTTRVPRSPEA